MTADTHTLTLDADGWLSGPVRRVACPNFNQRPQGCDISLLVIHNISLPPGEFGGDCIEDFFCNRLDHDAHPFFDELRGVEVSSHFLVDRKGGITQFVAVDQRAWHAGVSSFAGREACNDFSIGIELEGTDDLPYSDSQYLSLAQLTRVLQRAFPLITRARIVGHSDIATPRKTDPGPAFDWQKYLNAVS